MSPAVSVVIPTYNRAADLRRALASVRAQTVSDWEVIVVDNRSQDDTREVVEGLRDERIRLLEVDNQGVVALSRNVGCRHAKGEYIALLDSDDWWQPRKLEVSLAELRRGADIVYHDLYLVKRASQKFFVRRARTRALRQPVFEDLLLGGNALTNSSVVVRRSILEQVGGISEDRALIAFEDYDAWLRVAKTTERFVRIPPALGFYWIGGANLSTPERVLRSLDHFTSQYLTTDTTARGALPAWCDYAYGRAHYHLGAYSLSIAHMRRALGGRLVFSKKIITVLTLVAACVRNLWRAR